MSGVISEVVLGPFWLMLLGLGAQTLRQSILLKFSLETRLESKSFVNFCLFYFYLLVCKQTRSP